MSTFKSARTYIETNLVEIQDLENDKAQLEADLQETLEKNRKLQEQLASAEALAKKRSLLSQTQHNSPAIAYSNTEETYQSQLLKEKERRRLNFLYTQERINKQTQDLLFGHGVEEALAYVKKKQTFSYLDYLNFFSFDSADPLEDYFYQIHQQHSEASSTQFELIRDLNYGRADYSSYLKGNFDKFKNLVAEYKSTSAKLQLEFKEDK